MRNKLSKISIFSLVIILSVVIMFLPLAFMPEIGDNTNIVGVGQVAEKVNSLVSSNSTDGTVIDKVEPNKDYFLIGNTARDNIGTFDDFIAQISSPSAKTYGLLVEDISLKYDLGANRAFGSNCTLDGNGYKITFNGTSGTINNNSNKYTGYANKNAYLHGGLFSMNEGTIKNVTFDVAADIVFTNSGNDGAGIFAAGIVAGANKGTIQNVKVVNNATFTVSSPNYDASVGSVVGINSKDMMNVTFDNKGKISVGNAGTHYTFLGGIIGLMYTLGEYGTAMATNITVIGSSDSRIEGPNTTAPKFIGTAVGKNASCNMSWYLEGEGGSTNTYKSGIINGVINDYHGYISHGPSNNANYCVTGCGHANNVYLTDNVDPNMIITPAASSNSNNGCGCANTNGYKPNVINPNRVGTLDTNGVSIKVAFTKSGVTNAVPNLELSISIPEHLKTIIYDIDTITYGGETPIEENIVKVNNADKIANNHKQYFFTKYSANFNNGENKVASNSIININLGAMGSVEAQTSSNFEYDGNSKVTVEFKNATGSKVSIPNSMYNVHGYCNTGYIDIVTPGTYTNLKIQMNDANQELYDSSFAAISDNDRLIFPVYEKEINYTINPASISLNVAPSGSNSVYKTKYTISANLGSLSSGAIEELEVFYINNGKTEKFAGTSFELKDRDFGEKGQNIVVYGLKNGTRVTNASEQISLMLDGVAPDVEILKDVESGIWHTSNPELVFTAHDYSSGIDRVYIDNPGSTVIKDLGNGQYSVTFKEVTTRSYTIHILDKAGNDAKIVKNNIKIDTAQPTLEVNATHENNGSVVEYIPGIKSKSVVNFEIIANEGITNPSGYQVYALVDDREIYVGEGASGREFTYKLSSVYDNRNGDFVSFKIIANNGNVSTYDFGIVIVELDNPVMVSKTDLALNGNRMDSKTMIQKEYDGTNSIGFYNGVQNEVYLLDKNGNRVENVVVEITFLKADNTEMQVLNVNIFDTSGNTAYEFSGVIFGMIHARIVEVTIKDKVLTYGDPLTGFEYEARYSDGTLVEDGLDLKVFVKNHEDAKVVNAGEYKLTAKVLSNASMLNVKILNDSNLSHKELTVERKVLVPQIDTTSAPYDVMFTGEQKHITAYIYDIDGNKINLKSRYYSSDVTVGQQDPFDSIGNYTVKFSLPNQDYELNYVLDATSSSHEYNIFPFTLEINIDGLNDGKLTVPYFYGEDKDRFSISLDDNNINLLKESYRNVINDNLTITYNGKSDYPTDIGTYNVDIVFKSNNSSLNSYSKRITYNITKANFNDVRVARNTTVKFDGKMHQPSIENLPYEFVTETTGYEIMYMSKEEYDNLPDNADVGQEQTQIYKNRKDILFVVFVLNTDVDEEYYKLEQYKIGTYTYVINLYNVNYTNKNFPADLVITKPNSIYDFIKLDSKNQTKVYNEKAQIFDIPDVTTGGMNVSDPIIWLMDGDKKVERVDSAINAGTYKFIYTVTIENIDSSKDYNQDINDIFLTIAPAQFNPADIAKMNINVQGKDYDGKPLDVKYTPNPTGTTKNAIVTYEKEKYIDARKHRVKVTVEDKFGNYVPYEMRLDQVVINKINANPDVPEINKVVVKKLPKDGLTGTFKGVDGSDVTYRIVTDDIDFTKTGEYKCKVVSTDKNYLFDENLTVTVIVTPDYLKIGIISGICLLVIALIAAYIVYSYIYRSRRIDIKPYQCGLNEDNDIDNSDEVISE